MDKKEKIGREEFSEEMGHEAEDRVEHALMPGEYMTEELDMENEDLVFKLKKPFVFERKEYTEIDLSGLLDLRASDMIAVNNKMKRKAQGMGMEAMPELTLEYACHIASRATGLPIEFFMALPARDAMKVKGRVMGFLF